MAEIGRPTVMTPEVIAKLEQVFALGGTDLEAIFYADISKDALYDYQKIHPEFTERKERLKQTPVLKARQTIIKGLDNDDNARWFLERRLKNEFSYRSEVTGANGEPIQIGIEDKAKIDNALEKIL